MMSALRTALLEKKYHRYTAYPGVPPPPPGETQIVGFLNACSIVLQVYWSDLDAGTISRADLDGSNQEIIIAYPDECEL